MYQNVPYCTYVPSVMDFLFAWTIQEDRDNTLYSCGASFAIRVRIWIRMVMGSSNETSLMMVRSLLRMHLEGSCKHRTTGLFYIVGTQPKLVDLTPLINSFSSVWCWSHQVASVVRSLPSIPSKHPSIFDDPAKLTTKDNFIFTMLSQVRSGYLKGSW